jgi:hypothetical protein
MLIYKGFVRGENPMIQVHDFILAHCQDSRCTTALYLGLVVNLDEKGIDGADESGI